MGNDSKVQSVKELQAKAQAYDLIIQQCKDNPTKSRKWVLSLLNRTLSSTLGAKKDVK